MKQGWEIKKLGEVFDLQMGKTPSRDNGDYWGGSNVWVAISDLQGKYIGESKEHITDKALIETKIKKVKAGTTIMSFKLSVGRAAITTQDLYTNEAIMAFNLNEGYNLIADYIYYYLKGYKWQGANKAVMGITLNKASISQNHIAIPPLPEQEKIVEELDCLSGIIEKKREQLKELDALAQSIFYTMFGDPITNEKGWEVKKLGEVTTLYNGRAFKPTDWGENGLPIVRIQNLNNPNSAFNLFNGEVAESHRLYGGELLYAWSGTPDTSFGAHIWYGKDAVLNQHIFKVEFDTKILSKIYFLYYLNSKVHSMFDQTHGGVGLQHITKGTLTSQDVALPPLTVQQEFADKIALIEKQKQLIKKSIAQTEELFNSRMAYYFN